MADKRRHSRYAITEYIELKDESGAKITAKAVLVDVAFSGMALESEVKIEAGTIVQFELMSGALGVEMSGKGVVKHVSEVFKRKVRVFRIGIEFIDANQSSVSLLLNKIQRRATERIKKVDPGNSVDYGAF